MYPVDPVSFERWAVTAVGGHPLGHPIDAGIDGQIATPDGTRAPGRVLIAVKAGDRYHSRTGLGGGGASRPAVAAHPGPVGGAGQRREGLTVASRSRGWSAALASAPTLLMGVRLNYFPLK